MEMKLFLFLNHYNTRKEQLRKKEIVRNLSNIQQETIIQNGKTKYRYYYIVYFFGQSIQEKRKISNNT